MKTRINYLFLTAILFSTAVAVWSKTTYIPKYSSYLEIVNGIDTTTIESDKSSAYADCDNGMFRVAIIHETMTLERVKYIRRMENAKAWSIFSAFLSGVSSLSSDYSQRFQGQTKMYVSGTLAGIYQKNISLAKKLGIEVWIENTCPKEIMLSDIERGLTWYLRPGSIYKIELPNPDIVQFRISDLDHQEVRYVSIGAGSILRDAKISWENDQYWVFPYYEQYDDGTTYVEDYYLVDKVTGVQKRITKDEFKKIKNDK